MRRPTLLSIAVVAVLALFSATAQASAGSRQSADRQLRRSLDRVVDAKNGPPGAIAVVQSGSRRRVISAGVAVRGRRGAPSASRRMRIASVAKAFSGATSLALVNQGKLGLGDTIGRRLTGLPAAWSNITLAQALHHTSGLPDFSASKAFAQALVADLHGTPAPAQLLSYVATEPLLFPPGSKYKYSNTDNVVVALMVAAVTGQSYESALQSLVAQPLGLSRTVLPLGFELPAPAIHGYDTLESPPEDVTTLISAAWSFASGGVVSTPSDLNRFVRAYVGRKLFSKAVQQQQLDLVPGHSEPPGPGRNSAGLAIFRYRTSCGTVYGHTGNTPGYTQFVSASLDGRRSAVVSVNGQFSPGNSAATDRVFKDLRNAYLRAVCAALA